MVVHIHGGEFLAAKVMPALLKWLAAIALADGPVIVLSEAEREILQAEFPQAGAVVLPNCVELGNARTFRRSYSSDEPLKILFMGRICASKGVGVLYEALAGAVTKGVRFRFVMAGAGPDADLYVAKFRELLGEEFVFHGIVGGAEKLNHCANAKCSCFHRSSKGSRWRYLKVWLLAWSDNYCSGVDSERGHSRAKWAIRSKDDSAAIVDAIDRLSADGCCCGR